MENRLKTFDKDCEKMQIDSADDPFSVEILPTNSTNKTKKQRLHSTVCPHAYIAKIPDLGFRAIFWNIYVILS